MMRVVMTGRRIKISVMFIAHPYLVYETSNSEIQSSLERPFEDVVAFRAEIAEVPAAGAVGEFVRVAGEQGCGRRLDRRLTERSHLGGWCCRCNGWGCGNRGCGRGLGRGRGGAGGDRI